MLVLTLITQLGVCTRIGVMYVCKNLLGSFESYFTTFLQIFRREEVAANIGGNAGTAIRSADCG